MGIRSFQGEVVHCQLGGGQGKVANVAFWLIDFLEADTNFYRKRQRNRHSEVHKPWSRGGFGVFVDSKKASDTGAQ